MKAEHARALKNLYQRHVNRAEFVSAPVARTLTELSHATGRRIGLLVDRSGEIDKVVVGDAHRVHIPDLGPRRAGARRFRGLRLVHTSLRPLAAAGPGASSDTGGLTEEDLTDLALLQLDAVVTVQVQPDGLPGRAWFGYLLPPEDGARPWRVEEVKSVHHWDEDFLAFITDLEGQFARSPALRRVQDGTGAILIGVTLRDPRKAKRGLVELQRLATTAGLVVLDTVLARRDQIDGRTFVGKGKLQELVVRSMHVGASVLVFDRELAPSQLRNIAESTDLKVLDRTQLILDIFAQHAQSREGKLQVELAQLRYRMPRLAIMPTAMSRLTGGVGGRGPGETKLEINSRRARERQTRLERELDDLASKRALRRRQREREGLPVVSIVGYTNAGKSTLLNRITASQVLVEDKLFATLDPTSRRFRFPAERDILLTDTVGFIEDLPDTLIQAFKATLEELEHADLLLHVLDANDDEVESHKISVDGIVADLGLAERPMLVVWNKADEADPMRLRELIDRHGGQPVSALTGEGCEVLLDRIERALFREGLRGAAGSR